VSAGAAMERGRAQAGGQGGALVARVPTSSVAEARHAANVAASAFPRWSATGPGERRRLLDRAAVMLERRGEEIIRTITAETGGTRAWGELNVRLGASILREAASQTTRIGGEMIPTDRPGTTSLAVRQPCGVVLSMAPWNAPVVLGVRGLATPLACGNTVVFKASELCPGVHALIGEVFAEAGFPAGVVSVLHNAEAGATDVIEALVAHAAVRRVNFTGSTRAGRIVAAICARHLKKCLLELGGKAPLIVLDDADIEQAARAAAYGAFFHQGQICMSTERAIVQEAVADAFTARLRELALDLAQDEPGGADARLGPMIGEQAALRVKGLVDDALRKGARLVAGGAQRGAWLEPTVLDGVTSDMRIYHEETFGPVASIIRAGDVDEAVSIANDTEYGLAAAVFSRDTARALDVARRLETGICHINGSTIADEPQMPFGGMKSSGWGRFGGQAGIDEFTELRWITIQDGKQDYPI
jgi:acyl-CoA reductase-like NAD-dependent aldehyde dehydrogenase